MSGGLLTKYHIRALNARNSTILIIREVTSTTLRTYNVSGLEPYTPYNMSIVAFTSGGSAESTHARIETSEAGGYCAFKVISC